ncbi:hypothetical protein C805_01766 [Eubacterium sp. 14-2]|uniref:hypothetical protein n=1 Tax=Eubacterium sp. 14-2 TaxID=1235790 RepID=UPI00034082EF|nr:hypothetical protein [Eubacterium sp. 14-2]EOT27658.1 hypothetical protein C805_01766 [Eubacterium sp. 14-2]
MSRAAMQGCRAHNDCFANRGGVCTCLKDNDFGGRDCPFYKPADTVREGRRRQDGGRFYGNQQIQQ